MLPNMPTGCSHFTPHFTPAASRSPLACEVGSGGANASDYAQDWRPGPPLQASGVTSQTPGLHQHWARPHEQLFKHPVRVQAGASCHPTRRHIPAAAGPMAPTRGDGQSSSGSASSGSWSASAGKSASRTASRSRSAAARLTSRVGLVSGQSASATSMAASGDQGWP